MGRRFFTLSLCVFAFAVMAHAVPINVALNKPATATSTYSFYVAGRVVDGDWVTHWSSSSGAFPQWLEVDLEGVFDPFEITLVMGENPSYGSSYDNHYELQSSLDGSTWDILATGVLEDDPVDFPGDPVAHLDVAVLPGVESMQYVRYFVTAGGHWAHLAEMEVMVDDANGSAAIPEPATLSLLALGALALRRRRRK